MFSCFGFSSCNDVIPHRFPKTKLYHVVIILAVSRTLEVLVNSTLQTFHGCKMTGKGPKILIKSFLFFVQGESLQFDQCFRSFQ